MASADVDNSSDAALVNVPVDMESPLKQQKTCHRPDVTPTPTEQEESFIVHRARDDLWSMLFRLEFDKLFPRHVKKVCTTDAVTTIGTIFEVHYEDGAVWTCRVTGLRENKIFSYELISASPEVEFNGMETTFTTLAVAEATCMIWNTVFCSSVTQDRIQDTKFKKREFVDELQ